MAHWAALVLSWREHHTDDAVALLWKRVAYATRYGRAGLEEALCLGQDHLDQYIRALSDLVKDENPQSASSLHNR